jgi:Histidine kinase-, DNA gyrase B-, and HSP90-like ATPase
LPLRPSDKTALTPVMEAVSNSIHAITERFDEEAGKRGRVDVTVVRDYEVHDHPIIGFDIEDNGVGFTGENYKSFLTPDSRHKEKRGGKGVGRLAWLKVFEQVEIDSIFHEGGSFHHRHFKFRLADQDQVEIVIDEKLEKPTDPKTRISFRGFEPRFASRCPAKQGILHCAFSLTSFHFLLAGMRRR